MLLEKEEFSKQIRGVARQYPKGIPHSRVFSGVTAVAPIISNNNNNNNNNNEKESKYGIIATATLSNINFLEGELTIMSVIVDSSPMIIARRNFNFSKEPLYGISKIIWAGITVIGIMSSTGEVLCIYSGLRDDSNTNNYNDKSESESENEFENNSEESILRCTNLAVDICGLTVNEYPFLIIAGYQKTYGYIFPKIGNNNNNNNNNNNRKTESRDLCIGTFHSISAISNFFNNSALIVGCTLGTISIFELKSHNINPICIRSIFMGPFTRYMGISCGISSKFNKFERKITFCAFGKIENETNKLFDDMILKGKDGNPFKIKDNFNSNIKLLPSWNEMFNNTVFRSPIDAPSLLVTQPEIYSGVNTSHLLVITIKQKYLTIINKEIESKNNDKESKSSLIIDVKVLEGNSIEFQRALNKFNSNIFLFPTLRFLDDFDNNNFSEFCLSDGKRVIFFKFNNNLILEPCSEIYLDNDKEFLVGITWFPNSKNIFVLSGKVLENNDNASTSNKDKTKEEISCIIDNLILSSKEPLKWNRKDELNDFTLENLREIVRNVVQEENKKLLSRFEERFNLLEERIMQTLMTKKKIIN